MKSTFHISEPRNQALSPSGQLSNLQSIILLKSERSATSLGGKRRPRSRIQTNKSVSFLSKDLNNLLCPPSIVRSTRARPSSYSKTTARPQIAQASRDVDLYLSQKSRRLLSPATQLSECVTKWCSTADIRPKVSADSLR